MKRFLFIVPLLICLFSFREENKDVIIWKEGQRLTWDDFKGKPAKRFSAASTHYDTFKYLTDKGDKAEIEILAVFYINKSWKKSSWINDQVLEHEQKHFDVVELFARQLRKQVMEQKYSSYKNLKHISDSLYDRMDKDMDIYQDKYDDETDASMNGDKQREWNKKIAAELQSFSAYKNNSFTVTFSK